MKRLQSLLIATDFSDEAGAATRRGAMLARELGLRAVLAHVLPSSLPAALHPRAAELAGQALERVAHDVSQSEGVRLEPRLLDGDVAALLAQAAGEFDLVVCGARGAGLLRDFALGRTSEHLVRDSRRPVLVVKRAPQAAYRRVVAAVDFSEPSREAAACGAQLAPGGDFHFVNAFEVEFESTLRLAGAADDKIQGYRQDARERALRAMEEFVAALALPPGRTWPTVAHGYPPRVVAEQAAKIDADLLAIGKHGAGLLERLLVGSVALQVLERAACDVLVAPERIAPTA
jgi:nucleotide-binding universal stress UspA family protein